MLFDLGFTNNMILSCYFFSFLIINQAIGQIFKSMAGLLIPTGIPSKEAKGETEIHPVIAEAKRRKYQIQFRVQNFCAFL